MQTQPVILAAGQGTRMKSDLPKVLHPVLGHPMAWWALQAAQAATGVRPVMVIGHGADQVRAALGEAAVYVYQAERLGTGHAVQQAEAAVRGQCDQVLVTYGDMPLVSPETLRGLVRAQEAHPGPFTMLTVMADNPRGFGRIVRNPDGSVRAIVEEIAATPEILAIKELNPGLYCFNSEWLWQNIHRLPLTIKGEYFLTDLVEIAVGDGLSVQAVVADYAQELIGVNTPQDLADAAQAMQARLDAAA